MRREQSIRRRGRMAGPHRNPYQPVVGGVDVQVQSLRRSLGVHVAGGELHQRGDQRAAGSEVVGDEARTCGRIRRRAVSSSRSTR